MACGNKSRRQLNWTTRSVAPTEGRAPGERLVPTLGEVQAALDVVNSFRDWPAGTLRLNVPATVARLVRLTSSECASSGSIPSRNNSSQRHSGCRWYSNDTFKQLDQLYNHCLWEFCGQMIYEDPNRGQKALPVRDKGRDR
jgi:hypothetical protein